MSTNKRTLTIRMLVRVWRASRAHTATDQISITTRIRAIIIRVSVRAALARLKERSGCRALGLLAVLKRVVAYGAGAFVGAGDAVVEKRDVAAGYDDATAGAGDWVGVAVDWEGF